MDRERRNFIKAAGAVGITALAGCSGNEKEDGTDSEGENNDQQNNDDMETVIEILESKNIGTVPIVNEETSGTKAGIRAEVEDADGLENIIVQYNDAHRDQPLVLYDRSKGEFEQGVNGEMIPISEEFPQTVIAPNTGEFYIEVTDVNGNTTTRTQPIESLENSFRADRKRKQEGNVGSYSTERNWDNIVTDTEQVQEMHQNWLDENGYTPLVNQILNGEDVSSDGRAFPNYDLSGKENDPGFFDQDKVKNEDDFETLVRWYLPTIMEHDRQNYGSAPSSRFHRFAATMETLINEHHPEAEADATGVNSIPAHGIFGVQDQNNEEFYLVDTTPASPQNDEAVARIGGGFVTSEDGSRSDLWDPFHDFSPGKPSFGTYEGQSRSSMSALMTFRATDTLTEKYDSFFMTDEWMDEAYEVLRDGGSIQPITEPIEEITAKATEDGFEDKVGIYGTLDNTRIAVTDNQKVYETVMYNPNQIPGTEEIENML